MAKHGKDTTVLVDQYDLTSFLDNSETEQSIEVLDATTYGNDSKVYALGHDDGVATLEGLGDGGADELDLILAGIKRSTGVIATIIRGVANNDQADLMSAIQTQFDTKASVTGLVRLTAALQADQDGLDHGVILRVPGATGTSSNTSALNNGAASANGGVGHLHVSANSGSTPTLDVIIEDSPDGSTGWATIATFSQVTTTDQALRVEITGTVKQYIRAAWTIGGTTPLYTFAAAFARR
jgi:hypothetical protein